MSDFYTNAIREIMHVDGWGHVVKECDEGIIEISRVEQRPEGTKEVDALGGIFPENARMIAAALIALADEIDKREGYKR